MRASEALLLGSTLLEPEPFCLYNVETNRGCALGMMALAVGAQISKGNFLATDTGMRERLDASFPWLKNPSSEGRLSIAHDIATKFNEEVCGGRYRAAPTMTLAQLADWIESVDPTPKEKTDADEGSTHSEGAGAPSKVEGEVRLPRE